MTDEWNKSYEFQKINKMLVDKQLELEFLTAMKEARPFIERHMALYEERDYEAAIRVSELYGVPFEDRWPTPGDEKMWGTNRERKRRYIPKSFFTKFAKNIGDASLLEEILRENLYWKEYWAGIIESGWQESQAC